MANFGIEGFLAPEYAEVTRKNKEAQPDAVSLPSSIAGFLAPEARKVARKRSEPTTPTP